GDGVRDGVEPMSAETATTTPRASATAVDIAAVARGGALNLIGTVAAAILNFALVVVITRGLHVGGAGPFFVAVALFSILSNTCELGADTGLMRSIPRARVRGREHEARRLLVIATAPVVIAGAAAGCAMI